MAVVGGLMFGLLAALIVFGRRAQNAAYSQMEGQPGAAAAALRMLRRGLEDRPGDRVHQAAGHRAPGRRAPRASCWSARATPTGCAS